LDKQIVWCLKNSDAYFYNDKTTLPHADIFLAQAGSRGLFINVYEIHYKGYANEVHHFHEKYPRSFEENEIDWFTTPNHCKTIRAWMPYKDGDLPTFEPMNAYECEEFYLNHPFFSAWINEQKIKNVTNRLNVDYLYTSECYPQEDGQYVVINNGGTWLIPYTMSMEKNWLAPNGMAVKAWYPIPQGWNKGR